MFSENLPLSARNRIRCLLDTRIEHVIVMIRENLGLEKFDVIGNNILFFRVTEDLAETHVALIDDAQMLLLTRNVDAGSSILSVGVHIAILIS